MTGGLFAKPQMEIEDDNPVRDADLEKLMVAAFGDHEYINWVLEFRALVCINVSQALYSVTKLCRSILSRLH